MQVLPREGVKSKERGRKTTKPKKHQDLRKQKQLLPCIISTTIKTCMGYPSDSRLINWVRRIYKEFYFGLDTDGCREACQWDELEKTLESPLDCKEIQPVHPKGNQSWIFIGRTEAEAETPVLWPPDIKS